LPSKSKTKNELTALVAQHGLEPYLASTHALVALLDPNGLSLAANPAFEAVRGTQPDMAGLLSPTAYAEFERCLRAARGDGQPAHAQLDFGPEGGAGRYDCLFIPLADGRSLLFAERLFTALDLPEKYQRLIEQQAMLRAELEENRLTLEKKRKELQAVLVQVEEVSHTDTLTFLPNRRQMVADLQRQVTFAERNDAPLAISMLDLDHFKKVNDSYGHAVGDDVLRFVATQLREHIREPDLIGRYGGEEFLVILPDGTLKAASEQAARLCQQVRSTTIISGPHAISMTVSIGIAQFKPGEEDWRQLLDRADQALYQAKRNGRDQWAIMEA
jgi:diguanylate cyclase (GGDEF)-like protein